MPELPEVETVCQGLRPQLVGQILKNITLRRAGLRYPFPEGLTSLSGASVTAVRRRSKLALIDFDNGQTILLHLGMSGRVLFTQPNTPLGKHDHVSFHFKSGLELRLNDPRRFGFVDIHPTKTLTKSPHFKNFGPEPLDEKTFSGPILHTRLKGRKTEVKKTIMDSRIVVGVGNIYASEALFRAGIHPQKPANSLTKKQVTALYTAITSVLKEAITAGGSTLKDYARTDGSLGYFQHNFRVYGKEGKPCTICKTPLQKTIQAGRASFFCPTCQR